MKVCSRENYEGLAWALNLAAYGKDVRYYQPDSIGTLYEAQIHASRSPKPDGDADTLLFVQHGWGNVAEQFQKEGHTVIGASPWYDSLPEKPDHDLAHIVWQAHGTTPLVFTLEPDTGDIGVGYAFLRENESSLIAEAEDWFCGALYLDREGKAYRADMPAWALLCEAAGRITWLLEGPEVRAFYAAGMWLPADIMLDEPTLRHAWPKKPEMTADGLIYSQETFVTARGNSPREVRRRLSRTVSKKKLDIDARSW